MAALMQSSFAIRRKPLLTHTYAAVPQLSSSTWITVPASSYDKPDHTCSCREGCHRCIVSPRRDHSKQFLSFRHDETVIATDTVQPAHEEARYEHRPSTSPTVPREILDADPKKHVYSNENRNQPLWKPFWLRRIVLSAFCIVFMSLLVGLVLLYYFARKYHGISTQISSNHYYWTYGPTTILMVVVALWRQVDYTCRRLTPWEELDNQQIKTQKSLLLDYMSPFPLTSLLRATRYQHWSVVLSLVGFMLLKMITIFSTGLLVLLSTQISDQDIQLQTSSIISAEYYCGESSTTCNYSSPSIDSYMEFLGILNDRLPYPSGTTSTSVFEYVDLTKSIPEGAIITSTVPGFYPVFDCQVATVHDNAGFPTRDNFTFYGPTVLAN